MGKRPLRVGELVVAHSTNRKPTIYAAPLDRMGGGAFSFGLYLGGKHAVHDEPNGRDVTFVFVLDSATLRFGWCWADLIRRVTP